MERVELQLSDGQTVTLEIKEDRVTISADGAVLLTFSRADAWRLAEALDALSTQS